jgi:hypothetical protein
MMIIGLQAMCADCLERAVTTTDRRFGSKEANMFTPSISSGEDKE